MATAAERKAERKALAEAFRDANEKLEQRARRLVAADDSAFVPFLCECPSVDCTQVLLLTLAEYEAVRARGNRGIATPGHDDTTVERVVGQNDRFVTTEKLGPAGGSRAPGRHTRAIHERTRRLNPS